MIGTLLEKLFVTVGADLSGLTTEMDRATAEVGRASKQVQTHFEGMGKKIQNVGKTMMKSGAVMTATITAPLIAFGKKAADAAIESREAAAQVESALKSMGPVAGRTADQLSELAANLQKTSSFDDDEILKKVTANMLTFGNVTGKVFDEAQQMAVDLSARLGQDLQSSTIMLGKALNDPVKGLTALSRVGVSFTKEQETMIKAMAKAGDVAGAQGLMLEELKKQYGGAAQAARDAAPGSDTVDAWREFEETIGELILNVLPVITDMMTVMLNAFNAMGPEMTAIVVGAVALLAALGPIITVVGAVVTAVGFLTPLLAGLVPIIAAVGAGLMTLLLSPLGLIVIAVAAVVAAWYYWDEIVAVVQKVGKVISAWYSENVKPTVDAALGAIGPLVEFFKNVFGKQIESTIKFISALLKGDFAGAWAAAKEMVTRVIGVIITAASSLGSSVIKSVAALYNGVKSYLMDKLGAVFGWLKGKLEAVGGYFYDLYDKVVGHSYIPDMVSGIGDEMAKLERLMVQPAKKAAGAAKAAFRDLADDAKSIFDDLFPDVAELREIERQMSVIGKSLKAKQITPEAAGSATAVLEQRMADLRTRMSGPGENVKNLVASLLPDEAAIKQIRDDMATLDAAIDAGKGNLDEIKKARAALDVEMEKATKWPLTDELKSLTEQLFPLETEITNLAADMLLLNQALAAGEIDPLRYEQAKEALDGAMDKAEEALERAAIVGSKYGELFLELENFGHEIGNSIMSGLRSFLTGKATIGEVLRDGLSRILDSAVSAALRNLETSMFGKEGLSGFLGNLFGNIAKSSAGRAVGGPAIPGRAYDVGMGEKFVPSTHGRILSRNDAMNALGGQGGAPRQGDVHIHISGQMSDKDARRTGLQAGRTARVELAKNARVQPS
jgi:hypothetical protein